MYTYVHMCTYVKCLCTYVHMCTYVEYLCTYISRKSIHNTENTISAHGEIIVQKQFFLGNRTSTFFLKRPSETRFF